jgi:hypothetical protein
MLKFFLAGLVVLAGWGLCLVAWAAPVVIDTYAQGKAAVSAQYTVNADHRRLDRYQLRQALFMVAKDKTRGVTTPVAVLLDPALSLKEVSAVERVVKQAGLRQVRYFIYQSNRSMMKELMLSSDKIFPRSRLDSEMMAAPK